MVLSSCASTPEAKPIEAPKPKLQKPSVDEAAKSYQVVDVMPDFWRFWDKHRHDELDVQLAAFQIEVADQHPALFVEEVVDGTRQGQDAAARTRALLQDLPEREKVMRRISDGVAKDLVQYDATFRNAFPDMDWTGTVYFTVSLDAFDGAVRTVKGERALLFGIDKIARLHGEDAALEPLFHHELFHLYHILKSPPPDYSGPGPFGLDSPLWAEGLAVYVAKSLNPKATARQLVLSDIMIAESDANMETIATELLTLLDDATEAQYRDFFSGAGERTDIPKRCAYYVGMKVVEHAAKTRTLQELASLQRDEISRVVREGLLFLQKPQGG